ncbi:UDP-N-acetylmuramate--L-alanyl-gamma-D-glutamyl-meso-2,6-diaminoheptandioate ligase [Candidatus Magnetaquicoccaceae bacterium FCR-1]|uniref:UDP-N-acetylmuramate--L-alanyl-gamma-D-glutamyl-meso-2,6-diaminoheptandioate ligase n=1 Tax=Candidatus Magnetaquiglobus chichijimensis TaxID=3141448 RepID=A0ABQ0C6K1_9PROT
MLKHLHIIGICGTAMAGIAALAREAGWRVTGSDAGVYPPMSDFLAGLAIPVAEGFGAGNLTPAPDLVVVGNAISRGNPELEALLDSGLPYVSGPEWLQTHVLQGRHPVVVTGTHGKTTTTSLMARVWEEAGWGPGFLIGGIPLDFGFGARAPQGPWIVIEGDEYDTAFWDKRPKFLHYRPKTLILHNLEYDHADIYPDLEAIRTQFRLLLRTVPASGLVLANGDDPEIEALLTHAHSRVIRYGLDESRTAGLPESRPRAGGEGGSPPSRQFTARLDQADGRVWTVARDGEALFTVTWNQTGRHNVMNGLAVAAAALCHGMDPARVRDGLSAFRGVARRLQQRFEIQGVTVYDDFAHHPTAIATTLRGLRASVGGDRIWVILEPRSNTMRRRVHQERLAAAFEAADRVILARPAARGLPAEELLDVDSIVATINRERPLSGNEPRALVVEGAAETVAFLTGRVLPGDRLVVMSNGGFDGIHERLRSLLS